MNIGSNIFVQNSVDPDLWKFSESCFRRFDRLEKKRKALKMWNSEMHLPSQQSSHIFSEDENKIIQKIERCEENQIDSSNKENKKDEINDTKNFEKNPKVNDLSKFPPLHQNSRSFGNKNNQIINRKKSYIKEYMRSGQKHNFLLDSQENQNSGFSPKMIFNTDDKNTAKTKLQNEINSVAQNTKFVDTTDTPLLLNFSDIKSNLENETDEQMLHLVDKFDSSLASIWQQNIPVNNISFTTTKISPLENLSIEILPFEDCSKNMPDIKKNVEISESPTLTNWFLKHKNNTSLANSYFTNEIPTTDCSFQELNLINCLQKNNIGLLNNSLQSKSLSPDYLQTADSNIETADDLDSLLSYCSYISNLDDDTSVNNSDINDTSAVDGIYSLWGPQLEKKCKSDTWPNKEETEIFDDIFSKCWDRVALYKTITSEKELPDDNYTEQEGYCEYVLGLNNQLFTHHKDESVFYSIKETDRPSSKSYTTSNNICDDDSLNQTDISPVEDLLNSDRTHFQPIAGPTEINNLMLENAVFYEIDKQTELKENNSSKLNSGKSFVPVNTVSIKKDSCRKLRRLSSSTEELISILGDNCVDNEDLSMQEEPPEVDFFPSWKTGLFVDKATNTESPICHYGERTCTLLSNNYTHIWDTNYVNCNLDNSNSVIENIINDEYLVSETERKANQYSSMHKQNISYSANNIIDDNLDLPNVSGFVDVKESDCCYNKKESLKNSTNKYLECDVICKDSQQHEEWKEHFSLIHEPKKEDFIKNSLGIQGEKEYEWKSLLTLMADTENYSCENNVKSVDCCMYHDDKYKIQPAEKSYYVLFQENYPYRRKSDITTLTCVWEGESQFDSTVYPFLSDVLNVLDSPVNEKCNSALSFKQKIFFSPLSKSLPVDIEVQKNSRKSYVQERCQFSLPNLAVFQE